MITLLIAFATQATVATAERSVSVSLGLDRGSYYVGDPVDITISVVNETDDAVFGRFYPWDPERTDIMLQRDGEAPLRAPQKQLQRFPDPTAFAFPELQWTIQPHAVLRVEHRLLVNWATDRLVLTSPGDYEIYVRLRPWADPSYSVESNRVAFTLEEPPSEEKAALERFLEARLPRLVQTRPYPHLEGDALSRAVAFISAYPESRYADYLRRGLNDALNARVARGEATQGERAILEDLRAWRTKDDSRE